MRLLLESFQNFCRSTVRIKPKHIALIINEAKGLPLKKLSRYAVYFLRHLFFLLSHFQVPRK